MLYPKNLEGTFYALLHKNPATVGIFYGVHILRSMTQHFRSFVMKRRVQCECSTFFEHGLPRITAIGSSHGVIVPINSIPSTFLERSVSTIQPMTSSCHTWEFEFGDTGEALASCPWIHMRTLGSCNPITPLLYKRSPPLPR